MEFRIENSSLEDVLSDDKFNYYFDMYKNGDINARNILIEHNIKLIISIINKNFNSFYKEKEDMISEGVIGLITALEYYSPDKGIKFSTYATKCIITKLSMYCTNKVKKEHNVLSLDKEYSECENNPENNLYNLLTYSDNGEYSLFENKDYLNYLFQILHDYEIDMLEMYYGFGKYNKRFTEYEISKKYNCSRQLVSVKIHKILNQLKDSAENSIYRKNVMIKKGKVLTKELEIEKYEFE